MYRYTESHAVVARIPLDRAERFREEAARDRGDRAGGADAADAADGSSGASSKPAGRSEVGYPLAGDESRRGFYLTMGSGAGKRKYFYWLQHPNLEEAASGGAVQLLGCTCICQLLNPLDP